MPTINPHQENDENFITTWNHVNGNRFMIPDDIKAILPNINQSASYQLGGNPDRPNTSNVQPLLVDSRNNKWKFLEDWAYEFQGQQPPHFQLTQLDGSFYKERDENGVLTGNDLDNIRLDFKLNKVFNAMHIDQWRVHTPAEFIYQIDEQGQPAPPSVPYQNARKFYVKSIIGDSSNGDWKATSFTTKKNERYQNLKNAKGELINDEPRRWPLAWKDPNAGGIEDDYRTFMLFLKQKHDYSRLKGIHFGQPNGMFYTQFGMMRCEGSKFSFRCPYPGTTGFQGGEEKNRFLIEFGGNLDAHHNVYLYKEHLDEYKKLMHDLDNGHSIDWFRTSYNKNPNHIENLINLFTANNDIIKNIAVLDLYSKLPNGTYPKSPNTRSFSDQARMRSLTYLETRNQYRKEIIEFLEQRTKSDMLMISFFNNKLVYSYGYFERKKHITARIESGFSQSTVDETSYMTIDEGSAGSTKFIKLLTKDELKNSSTIYKHKNRTYQRHCIDGSARFSRLLSKKEIVQQTQLYKKGNDYFRKEEINGKEYMIPVYEYDKTKFVKQ